MKHTILVCTTCASTWVQGQRQGKSGGELLWDALTQLAEHWELAPEVDIQPVECMSACSQACVVCFQAAGKATYLFGPLDAQHCSEAVLDCAELYYSKPDGLMNWGERPPGLKNAVLARIPALPLAVQQPLPSQSGSQNPQPKMSLGVGG